MTYSQKSARQQAPGRIAALTGKARVIAGRLSYGRFCRESLMVGKGQAEGWQATAVPLLPDHADLRARAVCYLTSPDDRSVVKVCVDVRGVTIEVGSGTHVTVPGAAWAMIFRVTQTAVRRARQMSQAFHGALAAGKLSSNRSIKGAAVQMAHELHVGGRLTPGMVRRVWEAVSAPFGEAVMSIARWTGCNAGLVRAILSRYVAYWRRRRPDSDHWLPTLAGSLRLAPGMVACVITANKRFHRGRRGNRQDTVTCAFP